MELVGGPCCGDESPDEALLLCEGEKMLLYEFPSDLLTGESLPDMVTHIYRREGDVMVYEGCRSE